MNIDEVSVIENQAITLDDPTRVRLPPEIYALLRHPLFRYGLCLGLNVIRQRRQQVLLADMTLQLRKSEDIG